MRTRYRSFFWPAVLILIGIIALLANIGVISTDRLSMLADLWPLILVVVGLELIARRALHGANADLAAVLIVLIAVGGAVVYVAVAPNPDTSHTLDTSAAVGSLNSASLEIDAGAANITVTGASLEGDLYRAHIQYSGGKPDVSIDRSTGDLTISEGNNTFGLFASHRFTLDLQINSSVAWKIATNSGAATDVYKLADINVRELSVDTGASREEITLGKPSGIVPVTINGGALTVHLHRPAGVPAAVTVSGGAVSLEGDGQQRHGFGSQNWTSPGFEGARDAYKVEVDGGACTVTMDTTAAAA